MIQMQILNLPIVRHTKDRPILVFYGGLNVIHERILFWKVDIKQNREKNDYYIVVSVYMQIFHKIQQEITLVVGRDGVMSLSLFKMSLKYTRMCIRNHLSYHLGLHLDYFSYRRHITIIHIWGERFRKTKIDRPDNFSIVIKQHKHVIIIISEKPDLI